MSYFYEYGKAEWCDFEELKGLVLSSVEKTEVDGDDVIYFTTTDGVRYVMYHDQNCCENVYIESIEGELENLVGTPILLAEESTQDVEDCEDGDEMWTFYKLATIKGYVDIRWNGSSNGYYSVSVSFIKETV